MFNTAVCCMKKPCGHRCWICFAPSGTDRKRQVYDTYTKSFVPEDGGWHSTTLRPQSAAVMLMKKQLKGKMDVLHSAVITREAAP